MNIIIKILHTESLYHQYSETIYQFTQEMSLGATNEFRQCDICTLHLHF